MSRALVFLLGAAVGGGLALLLLLPRLSALGKEVAGLRGEVERLSFQLEAQRAENKALLEEARRAKEEVLRLKELLEKLKEKAGLPPEGQGGGQGLHASGWTEVHALALDLTLQAYEVEAALLRAREARAREGWLAERIALAARPGWPLAVPFRVSSPFGYRASPFGGGLEFHEGLDLAAPPGSPVLAVKEGVVEAAGPLGVYGLAVLLAHPDGYRTLYGHLEALAVRPGERVARGQVLGYVGSTGRSTGYHLHFGLYRDGVALDPWPYLLGGEAWR
ncbi:M23 family metallopeptidase [Thermus filiformis]|uniref:M23 family metallopeptidase n=1 Tax=Thermus filiformis TaxID=276 RepID=UPI00069F573A|nr:M23 family metallopeptidase [Thermus filiformis]